MDMLINEPDGKLSVLKKADKAAVTAEDLNIKKPEAGIMIDIILDGNILYTHLPQVQKDEYWIFQQLKTRNINNINDVVYAGLQADGKVYFVTKNV